MPSEDIVELVFPKPLPRRLTMRLLLEAGWHRGVSVLVNKRDRIIGLRGPRKAIEDIRHGR